MSKKHHKSLIFVHHTSPNVEEVRDYFKQKGATRQEAEAFFLVNEIRHWVTKRGNFIKNWKIVAYRWISSIWQTPEYSLQ